MKIVIDLQCCQTSAQFRGMGRYSAALAEAIVRIGKRHEFTFLLNYKYLAESKDILSQLRSWEASGEIVYHDYPNVQMDWHEREIREDVASLLRNNRIETVSPDLYHISSLFEGESIFGRAASYTVLPKLPTLRSATLYDFIPYLDPAQYLTNWQYANWFKRTLGVAQTLDIALAISETTKADAEKLLPLPRPRIVNIFGDVDARFRIAPELLDRKSPIWERLALTGPFVLYVGGPDPRKNVAGALGAFSRMPLKLRKIFKLVIVYGISDSEIQILLKKARELDIAQNVVIAGFVTDDELVELYNACDLFIFPSLYEGLGLPVIEAMRCGAPVLVGDNSSQKEIVDRPEYRFDAASEADMAAKMADVLTSSDRRSAMRAYSIERAQMFSWEKSARVTLDAWEEAYETRQASAFGRKVLAPRADQGETRAKPRIAMFTPLPHAETGISDYSADFIPHLCRFADVDLFVDDVGTVDFYCDGAKIYHHHSITNLVKNYDVIIYQLGNSPFHHYMLPYIRRFPGVVVIHDAYLGHLSHDPGSPDAFVKQVIRDHGGAARRIMLQSASISEGVRNLITELTCSPTHVHGSVGAIVHSQFARALLAADSRASVRAEIAVLPQYVAPLSQDADDRDGLRRRLRLPADKVILATFGHIAPTKGILELIASFKTSKIARSGRAMLVLVGQLEGGDRPTKFGQAVLDAIAGQSNIAITGFVDRETFESYVRAIDFGVQLRTLTRGETSRAMLTLLVNEVPFIHNRMGWSAELPDHVAVGIEALDSPELVEAIDRLAVDPGAHSAIAQAQRVYTREVLDGGIIADRFIHTALSMAARARDCHPRVLADDIARMIGGTQLQGDLPREAAAAFVNQERSEDLPRLLIDVSHIRERDLQTGVQRVVREIVRAAYVSDDRTIVPQTFAFEEHGLAFADDYAQSCGARHQSELSTVRHGPLTVRPFDRMVLADGSWHLSDWMRAPLRQLNACGGSAFALIHDILPLQHPELFNDHVTISVGNWLSLMARECDGLICTSKTAADDLIAYIEAHGEIAVRPGLRLGWSYLGSDPLKISSLAGALPLLPPALASQKNLFLVVGTIEPRKGHANVLDAFDKAWRAGFDVGLAFVGKRGWGIDALAARMDAHPEAGRRFFELGFVSDEMLLQLYKQSRAAIIGSIAEGFGLPIFEAAHLGAPLILSDLPIFKELGREHASYFKRGSADELFEIISKVPGSKNYLKSSNPVKPPSWSNFYSRLEKFVGGAETYHRF